MEIGRSAGTVASWIRHGPAPAHARLRLLCFPHAGAGASSFNGWIRYLPQHIELVRAQLPGREDNCAGGPFTCMDHLVPKLFGHLAPLFDRPLAIYGHSMGALVAFEVVREMRRQGLDPPIALFVSGRRAPHKPLRRTMLHRLSDADLVAHLSNMGGTSPALLSAAKWRERYLPTVRADLELSDIYQYRIEAPLQCPVHALLGEDDDEMHRVDWEAWSEQASGYFRRTLVPGGHVFSQAQQAVLVASISETLTELLETKGEAAE